MSNWFIKQIAQIAQIAMAMATAIALAIVIVSAPAHAASLRRGATFSSASDAGQGTFFSGYFDFGTGSAQDNALRLENPTAANGNLCAMIYIFNAAESMGECCGCPLTPNQLLQDSLKTVIGTGWVLPGGPPSNGVIQIVSALPNNGRLCVPYNIYTPTPTLNGWITHAQVVGAIAGLTEVDLTDNGSADLAESAALVAQCASNVGNGSGGGVCTCPKSQEITH